MVTDNSQYLNSQERKIDTWTISLSFIITHIQEPLNRALINQEIAMFGPTDTEVLLPEEIINFERIKSLNKLAYYLEEILDNTDFVIKNNKEEFEMIRKDLKKLVPFLSSVSRIQYDQNKHTRHVIINEVQFINILDKFKKLRSRIIKVLNDNQLIFKQIDSSWSKENIKRRLVEEG